MTYFVQNTRLADLERTMQQVPIQKKEHKPHITTIYFLDNDHRQRYIEQMAEWSMCATSDFKAAIYLLTAYEHLWGITENIVSSSGIHFEMFRMQGSDANLYAVIQGAKDLYIGDQNRVCLSDLADPDLTTVETISLLWTAVKIKRFGFIYEQGRPPL